MVKEFANSINNIPTRHPSSELAAQQTAGLSHFLLHLLGTWSSMLSLYFPYDDVCKSFILVQI